MRSSCRRACWATPVPGLYRAVRRGSDQRQNGRCGSWQSLTCLGVLDEHPARSPSGTLGCDGDFFRRDERLRTRVGDAVLMPELLGEQLESRAESKARQDLLAAAARIVGPAT